MDDILQYAFYSVRAVTKPQMTLVDKSRLLAPHAEGFLTEMSVVSLPKELHRLRIKGSEEIGERTSRAIVLALAYDTCTDLHLNRVLFPMGSVTFIPVLVIRHSRAIKVAKICLKR